MKLKFQKGHKVCWFSAVWLTGSFFFSLEKNSRLPTAKNRCIQTRSQYIDVHLLNYFLPRKNVGTQALAKARTLVW